MRCFPYLLMLCRSVDRRLVCFWFLSLSPILSKKKLTYRRAHDLHATYFIYAQSVDWLIHVSILFLLVPLILLPLSPSLSPLVVSVSFCFEFKLTPFSNWLFNMLNLMALDSKFVSYPIIHSIGVYSHINYKSVHTKNRHTIYLNEITVNTFCIVLFCFILFCC